MRLLVHFCNLLLQPDHLNILLRFISKQLPEQHLQLSLFDCSSWPHEQVQQKSYDRENGNQQDGCELIQQRIGPKQNVARREEDDVDENGADRKK